MKFLDGFKTVIGALGLVAAIVFPKVAPGVIAGAGAGVIQVAEGVFATLLVLGVIHKVEKARAE